MQAVQQVPKVVQRVVQRVVNYPTMLRVLLGTGIVRPYSPAVLARMARALVDWGTGPAGGFTALAIR